MQFTAIRSLVAGAALAVGLASAPVGAEVITLAHWVPPQHVLTSSTIEPLRKALAEKAPDITLKVYPGGELGGGPLEQYVRAVQDVADITWGLPGYTSSQFPKLMISELPGVLKPGEHGYDAIWNAWDKGMLKDEFPGTVPIALWLAEPNVFIMKDHDIRTPADLKGLKIRVAGAEAAKVISALGATPVQMPAPQIYNALQTGLIDGVVTGSSAIGDFKLDEVANSYTIGAPLGHISFYLVMNKGRYDGLSATDKAALDSIAGRPLSKDAEEGWNARAQQVIAGLKANPKDHVIELTPAQADAFGKLTLPVTDKVINDLKAQDVLAAMRGE